MIQNSEMHLDSWGFGHIVVLKFLSLIGDSATCCHTLLFSFRFVLGIRISEPAALQTKTHILYFCFHPSSFFQLMRIDVTNLNPGDPRESVDTAVHVAFTPANVGHLLVTTANNRLIKLDPTGRMVAEVSDGAGRSHLPGKFTSVENYILFFKFLTDDERNRSCLNS